MTLLLSLITASDFERSYLAYVKKWAGTWPFEKKMKWPSCRSWGIFPKYRMNYNRRNHWNIYVSFLSFTFVYARYTVFFFFFCSQLTHELSLTWSVAHLVTLPRPLQTSFLPFDSECFISAILAYGRPECEDVKNREE